MTSEKRLIDGNALTDEFLRHYTEQEKKGNLSFVACEIKRGFADMVNEAPTVDAVEVVRCKDCKQWCRNAGIVDSPNGHCFCHDIDTNQFDFCSYGERKDNG